MGTIFCCLKELLEHEEISIAQFAKQTGLAYNTVKRLTENNFTSIDLHTIEAICSALDCTPGNLLRRKSDVGKTMMTDLEFMALATELNIEHLQRLRKEWAEAIAHNLANVFKTLLNDAVAQQTEINSEYSQKLLTLATNHVQSMADYLIGGIEQEIERDLEKSLPGESNLTP